MAAAGEAAHADTAADRDLPDHAVARGEARDAAADLDDRSGPLVTGHDRVLRDAHSKVRERTFEDLDVGAADPDARRLDQQLALAGAGIWALDDLELFV